MRIQPYEPGEEGQVVDIVFNTMTDDIYIVKDRESWNDIFFGSPERISEWLGRDDWDNHSVFTCVGGKWVKPEEEVKP